MPGQELENVLRLLRVEFAAESPTIDQMRTDSERRGSMFPPPPDIQTELVQAGGVSSEWISLPGTLPDTAFLYMHGGGFVLGSINMRREVVARMVRASGLRGFVIAYRLAPEHPFPAALDDSLQAYHWLLAKGIKPNRISIAGDSAGGGLVVSMLIALRDAGVPLPSSAVCISPWVDLTNEATSIVSKADVDPILQKGTLDWAAQQYLGKTSAYNPLASPLFADLKGLPPLLIQVGTDEVLLDDSVRLAERAKMAGVDVTLEKWEHMFHVWHRFASMLPEGQAAIDRLGSFVQAHLA